MQTKPPEADPPKRKRRWFQFSLRTLLVVMLVAGVCARLLVTKAHRQKAAVETILRGGGTVYYDYQHVEGGGYDPRREPPGPFWLRKLLGDDFFTNVEYATAVTDDGLEQFEGLSRLDHVGCGRETTDAGLMSIKQLRHLQGIFINSTKITDAGLQNLEGLTQLRVLYLGHTHITDSGLKHLSGLTQLQSLNLEDTRITGVGLAHLTGLTRLQVLVLSKTRVDDAGMGHLKGFGQLQDLSLAETQVTDSGVEQLKGLTNLKSLDLRVTAVSDEGIMSLRRALPNRAIFW
jgi:hypothetical protein